jgi:hypothetical protein
LLYFLILPLFVLTLVAMTCATLAARFIEPLKALYPFAWRILLWSSIGFLVANSLMIGLFFLPGAAGWQGANQPIDLVKYGFLAILFLGPVIASLVGFIGGALLGSGSQ